MRTRATIGVVLMLLAVPGIASDSAEAQRRLGFKYYHGEGVAQDNKRAVELFEKAANAGDVLSASNLGMMYEFGMGVKQDDAQAVAWYRKAAEMGDADAQFRASVMYYKGQGVPQDRIEAIKWWTLATMSGGAFAQAVQPAILSAESKLSPADVAEGKRRAAEWSKARESAR
jgi:TPR repeat protein